MVISITHEQKEIIESRGLMVVQVKHLLRKVTHLVQEKVQMYLKAVREVLRCLCEKVKSVYDALARALNTHSVDAQSILASMMPKERYKIVKRLGLDYRVYFCRKGVYHCRNNY